MQVGANALVAALAAEWHDLLPQLPGGGAALVPAVVQVSREDGTHADVHELAKPKQTAKETGVWTSVSMSSRATTSARIVRSAGHDAPRPGSSAAASPARKSTVWPRPTAHTTCCSAAVRSSAVSIVPPRHRLMNPGEPIDPRRARSALVKMPRPRDLHSGGPFRHCGDSGSGFRQGHGFGTAVGGVASPGWCTAVSVSLRQVPAPTNRAAAREQPNAHGGAVSGALTALVPTSEDDLDLLATWFADPDFVEHWGGVPMSREEVAVKYLVVADRRSSPSSCMPMACSWGMRSTGMPARMKGESTWFWSPRPEVVAWDRTQRAPSSPICAGRLIRPIWRADAAILV